MRFSLLLAQSVEEGVGVIQTIVNGGAPLILACVSVLLGYAFYHQLRKNSNLESGFREKIEALLREMLTRDREAQEATSAAVTAIDGFSDAMKEQRMSCDNAVRITEHNGRLLEDLKKSVDQQGDRIRALEDEIRRGNSA